MKRSVTEMVFMLLLLTLFVGCSFVTIERCASFYQRMLREQRQDDQVQLPYLVLFNRLQGVRGDQVRVQRIGDQECLMIREEIDGRTYETVFYVQEGQLMELLMGANRPLDLSAGEKLAASAPIRFELQGSSLQVQWQGESGIATLSLELKECAE